MSDLHVLEIEARDLVDILRGVRLTYQLKWQELPDRRVATLVRVNGETQLAL
jgi:hypothetical protein